ncbi:hypothetical protein IIA95_00505 [Patescibacteria group bacterium]|nr:hypothetical protein [Patescibacteria group bacterium]
MKKNAHIEEQKKDSSAPNSRPAFVRIAPGAKVDGLTMVDNTAIGDADFLDNQGELKDATLEGNKHIVPNNTISKRALWKRPEIVIPTIIAIISIPWWPSIFRLLFK